MLIRCPDNTFINSTNIDGQKDAVIWPLILQLICCSSIELTSWIVSFAWGFNQAMMCSEPRAMIRKNKGKVDPPIYTIHICIPYGCIFPLSVAFFLLTYHLFTVLCLIFSFTNGVDWDGPYKLQFQAPSPIAPFTPIFQATNQIPKHK